MKKIKISASPILKFLRELSVIVTGIVITVGLGFWVNKRNNEKDLKLYLTAVSMELEENANRFDLYAKWMQKSVRYANYLRSNDNNSLNRDSLDYYRSSTQFDAYTEEYAEKGYGCGYMIINSYADMFTTYSFEMLQISGLMRHIKDKQLLSSIWEAYSQINIVKNFLKRNFQIKEEEALKEFQLTVEGKPAVVPMKVFYNTDLPENMVQNCISASKMLKETISKLEEAKMVKR